MGGPTSLTWASKVATRLGPSIPHVGFDSFEGFSCETIMLWVPVLMGGQSDLPLPAYHRLHT